MSDKRGIRASFTPWTYKAVLAGVAAALGEIAKALDRIATEYERRGRKEGGPDV